MKSDRGEIEVFLCPEEDALASNLEDSEDNTQSPIKIKREKIADSLTSESLLMPHTFSSQNIGSSCTTTSQSEGSPYGPTNPWEAPSRNSAEEDNQVQLGKKGLNKTRFLE